MVELVAWIYGCASLLAVLLYALDKHRAVRGGRRVPEATLHGVELLGGWPGALLAQRLFSHKTRKTSYQIVFWCIALAHVLCLSWWFLG